MLTDTESREVQEVFGIPVEDTIDELIMSMLGHTLPSYISWRTISAEALTGEIIEQLSASKPRVLCVGSLQPGGWKEMRYVVKRLQATFPELPLVLARWGLQNEKKERELARTAEVSAISPTLKSARNFIVQFLQLAPEPVTLEFPRARGGAHESSAN